MFTSSKWQPLAIGLSACSLVACGGSGGNSGLSSQESAGAGGAPLAAGGSTAAGGSLFGNAGVTGTGGLAGTGGIGGSGTGGSSGTGAVSSTSGAGGNAWTGGAGGIDAGLGGAGMSSADAGTDAAGGTSSADAGTDAAGGNVGSGRADGGDGSASARPPCITKSSQVVLFGDSYINWVSHTFPQDLYAEAGQTFRNYAQGGWSMGSGGIGFIPTQLPTAIAADPDMKVAIMTGGGNDVLVPDTVQFPQGGSCKNDLNSPNIADCQAIVDKAISAALGLMDDAVAAGIEDVVYFFYPHVPEGTLIGGLYPNAILDYALPKVKAACDDAETTTGGALRCHFIDLVPVFDGHSDWFAPTDIHPNIDGSKAMAQVVWQRMVDDCIGQTADSGCCEP